MRYDYVIVGAGPAGLQMGHHLQSANRSYIILERGDRAGMFFTRFPRHRFLLSLNKRHNWFSEPDFNLRHDWNSLLSHRSRPQFTQYTADLYPQADALVRYLNDYARDLALHIRYRSNVVSISGGGGNPFCVTDDQGRHDECRVVLMATGAVRPHIPKGIEGLEHTLGYEDHPIDVAFYSGKRVAIIGKGNAAFEVGNHLAADAAILHLFVRTPVRHAWETHYPGDLRSINNTLLDMYQLKSLHATLGFQLRALTRREDGALTAVVEEEYPHWDPPRIGRVSLTYDHVIRCTGWEYVDRAIINTDSECALDSQGKYPKLTTTWESSVPGLYFIGTAMQSIDRATASAFIHGFRYNVRTLFNILEERLNGVPYPTRDFAVADESALKELASFLITRVSTTSGLYQQFGFLCDVLTINGRTASYSPELPVAYVLEHERFLNQRSLVTITLEYGFKRYPTGVSTLEFIHPSDPNHPRCSAFLHPIFRQYHYGQLERELELGESLVVRYDCYDYDENNDHAHEEQVLKFLCDIVGLEKRVVCDAVYIPDVAARVLRPWPTDRRMPVVTDRGEAECQFWRVRG
jgi:thioredoxin reductase